MADKDDQDWTETLAGKDPAGADPRTVKEAEAVRRAMLEERGRETPPVFDAESGLQRLLFRLQREQLGTDARARFRHFPALALAATVVLTVGLVLLLPRPEEDVRPVTRGFQGTQVLLADDPRAARDRFVQGLKALGIEPRVTPRGGATLIEAPWPAQAGQRHRALLDAHFLRPPEGRTLVVEIRGRP